METEGGEGICQIIFPEANDAQAVERKLGILQAALSRAKEGKGPALRLAGDSAPLTLKRALLSLLRLATQIVSEGKPLSESDQMTLYEVGMQVGNGGARVELEEKQYNALKRVVDSCSIKDAGGQPQAVFGPEVRWQVKMLVDQAETANMKNEI